MFLDQLAKPVEALRGVGPGAKAQLEKLGIRTTVDLVLHIPKGYEDRTRIEAIAVSAKANRPVFAVATVLSHAHFAWNGRRTLKIVIRDDSAKATLVCFGRPFLAGQLPPGLRIFVYGHFSNRFGEIQCSAFDFEPESSTPRDFLKLLPLYSLSGKLTQRFFRTVETRLLDSWKDGPESPLPMELKNRRGFCGTMEALRALHAPISIEDSERALETLKFEEMLAVQTLVARRSHRKRAQAGRAVPPKAEEKVRAVLAALPFELTEGQRTSLAEIRDDLHRRTPMNRLLQGDVGSGKTLVALLASVYARESGFQTALAAPTELLARQHAENAARLLAPLAMNIAFLSASLPLKRRGPLLEALRKGEIDLIVGTHALFTESVRFQNLGFVIIDEQQRFGVEQRELLAGKGPEPHRLMMTATPIPRTLCFTAFADLDLSVMRELPRNRIPVETHLARKGNETKVYERIEREIRKGRQAYFVYPLIDESEKLDLKNAMAMHAYLSERFKPLRCGLLHSRLPEEQKEATMAEFQENKIQILVSTSVVEVGVDVPNATAIVVEEAERFGLSALHQLRGRVGRGPYPSSAFFVYSEPLSPDAKKRLKILKETTDGFRIAEEDLAIRGPGDMAGVRQSGFFRFRVTDPVRDARLIADSREEAFRIVERDPGLLLPDNQNLRRYLDSKPPLLDPAEWERS